MTDDDSGAARGLSQASAITARVLDGGNDGTFGHPVKGKAVTDGQLSSLTAVDKLTSVETLDSDEDVLDGLVSVGVTEDDLGDGGTSAGVVHDVSDKTLHVTVALGIVEGSQLSGTLTASADGLEDQRLTLTLNAKNATHGNKSR